MCFVDAELLCHAIGQRRFFPSHVCRGPFLLRALTTFIRETPLSAARMQLRQDPEAAGAIGNRRRVDISILMSDEQFNSRMRIGDSNHRDDFYEFALFTLSITTLITSQRSYFKLILEITSSASSVYQAFTNAADSDRPNPNHGKLTDVQSRFQHGRFRHSAETTIRFARAARSGRDLRANDGQAGL